jgi:hypothetical protein
MTMNTLPLGSYLVGPSAHHQTYTTTCHTTTRGGVGSPSTTGRRGVNTRT